MVASTLSIAASGIFTNKARTILTLLGVIIGVASVIVAVGIGNGSATQVSNQLSSLGTNLIQVQAGSTFSGGVRGGMGSASTLKLSDAQALADNSGPSGTLPDVALVAPEFDTTTQIVAGSENTNASADGVTPEYTTVRNASVAVGRFLTTQDVVHQSQVVDLGATILTALYPNETAADVVGTTITLSGIPFEVVGVMSSKGGGGGVNQDNVVYIPLTTAQNILPHSSGSAGTLSSISIEATQQDTTSQAEGEVEAMLRSLHHLRYSASDDFSFFSQTSVQETAASVSGTMTKLLAAVAACSLLVGGIGIMNIMLVTVSERTREIGLRKAVGARKIDILSQFLVEATLISASGGAIGVGVSFLVTWLLTNVQSLASTFGTSPPVISPTSVVLAFCVSLAIGLFFGSYPASRAAALDPIQALRYE
jgi:putative ABC transport system permease protein